MPNIEQYSAKMKLNIELHEEMSSSYNLGNGLSPLRHPQPETIAAAGVIHQIGRCS
jgi:hypothetical protein